MSGPSGRWPWDTSTPSAGGASPASGSSPSGLSPTLPGGRPTGPLTGDNARTPLNRRLVTDLMINPECRGEHMVYLRFLLHTLAPICISLGVALHFARIICTANQRNEILR